MIKEEIKDENLPSEATNLIIDNPKCARFYPRPKIHKTYNTRRPIVSNCSFPTERDSKYLDEILNPIVENLRSYVKDSTHVLNIFENLNYTDSHRPILFTMDVILLYTVIPHGEGLKAIEHFLNTRNVQDPPTNTIIRLADFVLTWNVFEFDKKFYT